LVPAIASKVDNDGRLVFAELAGRVGWLKPNGEHTGNTKLQQPSVLLVLATTAICLQHTASFQADSHVHMPWYRLQHVQNALATTQPLAPLCAGEITTLAGWVTQPGKEPAWIRKPLSVVRGTQQLRGKGTVFETLQGFKEPIDTAFDPTVPSVIYVSDLGYHCIWRLTILAGVGSSGEPNVQVGARVRTG
jgi:hypothetical protein